MADEPTHEKPPERQEPPRAREPQESPSQHVDKKRLKRNFKIFLTILIVVAVALGVWGVMSRLVSRSDLQKTTDTNAELTVITAKPTLSDSGDELVLPGTVTAYVEAPIYARTSGYVKAWYTDIGTRVEKGQLLALIETPEVDRQLKQAQADLATAQANSTLAKSTNERWQRLYVTRSVSKQDADEKAGDAAAKSASADSAAENVGRLKELEGFRRVVAPFAGVVTARNTDVGSLINAGQAANTELFRVADIRRLRIFAQVPEAYAVATTAGLKAELHFEEHPGMSYPADTVRTSKSLDPSARTLQVELKLDNPKGEFFPGAYTEVHFKLPASVQTWRLPANTVLFRAAGLQVATVDADHKLKLKNIQEGRDFGKTVEVLTGVDGQDDVIVNPPDSAFDGTPVRVAEPPPQPTQSTPSS